MRRRVAVAVAVVVMVVISVVTLVRIATAPATISAATAITTRRAALELFVLLPNIAQQVFAKLFGFRNHAGIGAPAAC
jgi:hypothetical protein